MTFRAPLTAGILLATASLAAQAQARPMTPEDVARLESVGTIAVSSDGSRIAYTTASLPDVTDGEENGSTEERLNLAYGPNNARAFLPEDIDVSGISFSPDGRMISFVWADEDEKSAVWGIPVDGGGQRKLAAVDGAGVRSYAWSPDGTTIWMLAGAEEDKARDKQSKAGFNAIVYEEEAKLTRLFSARVGETPGKLGDIEISPDGTQLSMIAGVDMNDPAETTLHLVDMATGQYRALNAGAPEAAVDAEWLADGRLAAVIHKGAQSALRIYNADGSVAAEHDGGELILSSIQAGGNTIAVEASSPQHPTELFVWKDDGFQRWTTHNDWLKDIDFGKQRAFTYTARDGQEVEGVLIEPVGGAKRGGAPLILNVHGGPEAHDSNGWQTAYSKPGQVAAGQGYAVFLPNYRGSTGYGTAFSKQHTGNYTDPEFTDLVDAKRALVDAGIADPDRTGITGGSYGGYATGWAATALSDEFAAGVMFVGISNQVSKFGTTDIPYEMYNVHSGKWPWDDWQAMLEVSPIYHVDKANTPLLIMHGAEDTRVAPSQSYELYRSMKVRKPDVPVRLVLFPGEGHGNSRAAARYDYNLRMMRWFDTYLKTGDRKAKLPATRPDLPAGTTGTASAD
jgi:dipeptidyl aminopeptidase/acylaminoacyl peptidase